MRPSTRVPVALSGALLGLLAGCAAGANHPAATDPVPDDYVFSVIAKNNRNHSRVDYDTSLADWLPNRTYTVNGRSARPLGSGVVIGRVTAVAPGAAYAVSGPDAVSGVRVPFDSPRALWRSVTVTLTPERAYGEVAGHRQVRFGLTVDGTDDADAVMASLKAQRELVIALGRPGRFPHDRSLYSVGRDGQLLGRVGADDVLSLPAFQGSADRYLGPTRTEAALADRSRARPARVVVRAGQRQ